MPSKGRVNQGKDLDQKIADKKFAGQSFQVDLWEWSLVFWEEPSWFEDRNGEEIDHYLDDVDTGGSFEDQGGAVYWVYSLEVP